MTRDGLIRGVWDAKTRSGGSGPARATVSRLRRKIGDNGSIPRYFLYGAPRRPPDGEARDAGQGEP